MRKEKRYEDREKKILLDLCDEILTRCVNYMKMLIFRIFIDV